MKRPNLNKKGSFSARKLASPQAGQTSSTSDNSESTAQESNAKENLGSASKIFTRKRSNMTLKSRLRSKAFLNSDTDEKGSSHHSGEDSAEAKNTTDSAGNSTARKAPRIIKSDVLKPIERSKDKGQAEGTDSTSTAGRRSRRSNHSWSRNRGRRAYNNYSSTTASQRSKAPDGIRIQKKGSSNLVLTLVSVFLVTGLCLGFMAPTIRAWINQSQEYSKLQNEIEQTKQTNQKLQQQLQELSDENHIADQARQRLGYVRQGETTYVVVDPQSVQPDKVEQSAEQQQPRKPWFNLIEESVRNLEKPKGAKSEANTGDSTENTQNQ